MKKLVSLILVLVLMFSMSITVFAADIEETGGSASSDVKASYNPGEGGGTVISVDIAWNNLSFTYNGESHPVWDPVNHEYTGTETPAGWATSNATITITNHSNTFMSAILSYSQASGYADASVVFSGPMKNNSCEILIGNAANGKGEDGQGLAQVATVQVVPTGFIANTGDEPVTIGTITVTLKDALIEYSSSISTFGGVVAFIQSTYNEARNKLAVDDPAPLEHGTIYVIKDNIVNMSSIITKADQVDRDTTKTDLERIQAINEAIAALYPAYQIKQ